MKPIHKEDVRIPVVAGLYYPGQRDVLESDIDTLLRSSTTNVLTGEIKALIAPHAGYMFSGRVAAVGYKQLFSRDYPIVAIISPNHHDYFEGVSVFTGKGYKTPLGLVPIATNLAEDLIATNRHIFSSWAGHQEEHALEVQIPFLQKVLKDFQIIPIVMGDQLPETCKMLGESLAKVLADRPALIIASSDLSHNHTYHEAVKIDLGTCDYVAGFNENALMNALQNRTCEACGGGPIVATMIASKIIGAVKADVLHYENSGDITGDYSNVVGYLSAAFYNVN